MTGAADVQRARKAEWDLCMQTIRHDYPVVADKVEQRFVELAAELRLAQEEIRLREESQIPMIPRAAHERLQASERRVAELEEALGDCVDAARDYWRHSTYADTYGARGASGAIALRESLERAEEVLSAARSAGEEAAE